MVAQKAETQSQVEAPDNPPVRLAASGVNLLRSSSVFALLVIVAASAENFLNPDLWRQILSGRQILQTGNPRLHDIFSYTAYGLTVRDHEWLAQVVMALFYNPMGVWGLLLFKLLCAGATIVFLAIALAETGASARIQRAVLMVMAAALIPNMQFRPQLFTFAFLAFEMALLARETYRGPTAALWLMVPVFALWANLHGGFLAGLGAIGVFALVSALLRDLRRSSTLRRSLRPLVVTAACALATCANPFGFHMWAIVLSSVGNSAWHKVMVDWQPLLGALADDLRTRAFGDLLMDILIPLGVFTSLAVFVGLAPSWEDIGLLAVSAVFVAASFHTVRFQVLAEIVIAVPLARHAELFFARRAAQGKFRAPDSGFNPIVAGILILALMWIGGMFSGRLRVKNGVRYPAGAVAFMESHGMHGNVLSEFRWASYVMWHMEPRSRIFIDERAETLYPDKVLRDYLKFYFDRPGARRVLDSEYPNQFVLVPPASKAYGLVSNDRNWKLIYRDNVAALFARAESAAAREFISPVHGNSPRVVFP